MARYVLNEAASLELFSEASVWDDFPARPGQVGRLRLGQSRSNGRVGRHTTVSVCDGSFSQCRRIIVERTFCVWFTGFRV